MEKSIFKLAHGFLTFSPKDMSQESVSTQVHGNEERRTVSEKIVALTHLPYAAGCIVIGVLVGYPGFFLMSFLEGF